MNISAIAGILRQVNSKLADRIENCGKEWVAVVNVSGASTLKLSRQIVSLGFALIALIEEGEGFLGSGGLS